MKIAHQPNPFPEIPRGPRGIDFIFLDPRLLRGISMTQMVLIEEAHFGQFNL